MPPNYTAVGNYENDNLSIKFLKIHNKIKLRDLNCLFRFLIGVAIFKLQWNLSKETKLSMHV